MKKTIIAVTAAAVLAMAAGPVAYAQEQDNPSPSTQTAQPESRAQALASNASEGQYTDRDVAKLLLVGDGPMATPELNRLLGFDESRPKADPAELEKVLDLYLATVPDFDVTVSAPFQSGDPIRVDAALRHLSTTFNNFVNEQAGSAERPGGPTISPQGWTWMGANVAIYANAVALSNAVGYTNVGVATLALATIAFVTWYLPGYDSTSDIDRDARVAQLADAVSK